MKEKLLYLALGIFLICIIYQTVSISKEKTYTEVLSTAITSMKINDSVQRYVWVQCYVSNDGFKLNNPKVYLGNDTSHAFNLFNSSRKGPYLIFRFSGLFCDKCIDELIKKLKKAFPDFKTNNRVVLLCSDVSPRIKEDYYGKQTLSYMSSNIGLPFEQQSTPFFFVVDDDKLSKAFFIPDNSQPETTDQYLRLVKHRYF